MTFSWLIGGWRPQIGDPFLMGWLITASYFICAVVAFITASVTSREGRRSHLLWIFIALLMIFLGINKQLDLQSLFTEIGRQVAKKQGWMEERRIVQFWFIVGFGVTVIIGFILFTVVMRNVFQRFMLAFIGLFFLMSFIFIRAASFHHFDQMLGFRVFGAKMNWLMELTGIYAILIAGIKEVVTSSRNTLSSPMNY